MINLNLDAASRQAFRAALHSRTQLLRLRVHLYDRNEQRIGSFLADDETVGVISGQVDIAAGDVPTRRATLTIEDPDETITLAPDGAGRFVYFNHWLRIDRGIWVGAPVNDWVDVPLIFGRLTQWQRQGAHVTITCAGKESVLTPPYAQWQPMTFRKGTNTVTAIRRALESKGERRFEFPPVNFRLSRHWSLGRYDDTWKECAQHARMMGDGWHLYYDGRGRAKLRPIPVDPMLTVDETWLTAHPEVTVDMAKVRNVVDLSARSVRSKGNHTLTRTLQVYVAPDPANPLSPARLGRNGANFYLPDRIDSGHHVRASAVRWARRHLTSILAVSDEQSVDVLPILGLEELDSVRVVSRYGDFTARLTEASIPLTLGGSMSLGRQSRLRPVRRRLRTVIHKHHHVTVTGKFDGKHHGKQKTT